VALAACGGSPTDVGATDAAPKASGVESKAQEVYDEVNGLTGPERNRRLVELAEAEGALTVYTSNTELQGVIDLFQDTYDIEVQEYEGNSESVLQRLLQEDEAQYFGADVVESNATELGVANREGLLAEYASELRDQVPANGQAENWTASRFNVFAVAWNTDLVADSEVPADFEELADPKWKGRVSMEIGDIDWYVAVLDHYIAQGRTEEEVEEMFRKVAANSIMAKGHSTQAELLSAGQYHVAVSAYTHNIDKLRDKGAPVAWRTASGGAVSPIIVRPNGVATMKTATHPAAAVLFTDFVLSPPGQAVFEEFFRVPAIPSGTGQDVLAGLDVSPVPEQKMLDDAKTWGERYEAITQGAQS
jgi:iron(III) transport system substrate-binding protein